MSKVRTAARARRALAAMVLGWLAAFLGAVLLAPAASAGTTVTVGKTAPAPLTLHPGDTVTFVNGIAPLPVTVPGVTPVQATALTDVVLGGPCGGHTLAPATSYSQTFGQTGTCPISYAYAVQGAPLAAVQALLPPLPSPTSVLVTVVQAASAAVGSVAPPPPPPVPAPAPGGGLPVPVPAGGAAGGSGGGTSGGGTGNSGAGTTIVSGGSGAVPGGATAPSSTPAATPQSAPAGPGAANAFHSPRFTADPGLRSGGQSGPGSGALRSNGGATVPLLGQLAGLNDRKLDGPAPAAAPASSDGGTAPTLPTAALAAVVALSAVIAALVRTHLAAHAAR